MFARLMRRPLVLYAGLALWALLLVAVAGKHLAAPYEHTVYPLYTEAAREWWGGDDGAHALIARQYLPYFGDLVAPFAALPDGTGAALWWLVSAVVLLTGLHRALGSELSRRDFGLLLLLAPWLGMESYNNGQANILVAGCFLWALSAVRAERWWLAAACLALPGFKLYTLALGLLYSAVYVRRLAPRFLLAVAALLAAPLVFHSFDVVVGRYRAVATYIASGDHYRTYSFIDVRSFLTFCGVPLAPRSFAVVQAAAGAFLIPPLLWRKRRDEPAELARDAYFQVMLWCVVFGPSVEPPTLVLAAPALAWRFVKSRRRDPWPVWLGIAIVLILAGPLQTAIIGTDVQGFVVQNKLACPGLAAMFAWEVVRSWRAAFGVVRRPAAEPVAALRQAA